MKPAPTGRAGGAPPLRSSGPALSSRGSACDSIDRPGASPQDRDLALLRAHEPVVRYTKGELFLPTAVDPYVAQCSLWAGQDEGDADCIVAAGDLTLERLCQEGVAQQDRPLSLRFVQAPLRGAAYRRWRRSPRDRLEASARFTTTGMFGRLVDAGFRASLLLRG